jgi:hypothetical protein
MSSFLPEIFPSFLLNISTERSLENKKKSNKNESKDLKGSYVKVESRNTKTKMELSES